MNVTTFHSTIKLKHTIAELPVASWYGWKMNLSSLYCNVYLVTHWLTDFPP